MRSKMLKKTLKVSYLLEIFEYLKWFHYISMQMIGIIETCYICEGTETLGMNESNKSMKGNMQMREF